MDTDLDGTGISYIFFFSLRETSRLGLGFFSFGKKIAFFLLFALETCVLGSSRQMNGNVKIIILNVVSRRDDEPYFFFAGSRGHPRRARNSSSYGQLRVYCRFPFSLNVFCLAQEAASPAQRRSAYSSSELLLTIPCLIQYAEIAPILLPNHPSPKPLPGRTIAECFFSYSSFSLRAFPPSF